MFVNKFLIVSAFTVAAALAGSLGGTAAQAADIDCRVQHLAEREGAMLPGAEFPCEESAGGYAEFSIDQVAFGDSWQSLAEREGAVLHPGR